MWLDACSAMSLHQWLGHLHREAIIITNDLGPSPPPLDAQAASDLNARPPVVGTCTTMRLQLRFLTWWTFRIFLIFFCSGRGNGESEAPGEGGGVDQFLFLKIPGGGGVSRRGRSRGAGRVSAANWGIFGGGGANFFFFRGRNVHQAKLILKRP